jgi:glycosyltransferase involved in cell wall biosynthesis
MPCYHEEETLEEIVSRVRAADRSGLDLEIVMVDDGSVRDRTVEIAEKLAATHPEIAFLRHRFNRGKGAAVATGVAHATGDIVLIQDADLEYDPADYPDLLEPILQGRAQVVLGSRFVGGRPHRVLYFWHMVVNRILTLCANVVSNLNLTDMEVGYKVFTADVIRNIRIEEPRFGVEPEIVCKVALIGCAVYEVGISYSGRTYDEGKKIGWRDGVRAIYAIVRYGLVGRSRFRREYRERLRAAQSSSASRAPSPSKSSTTCTGATTTTHQR